MPFLIVNRVLGWVLIEALRITVYRSVAIYPAAVQGLAPATATAGVWRDSCVLLHRR